LGRTADAEVIETVHPTPRADDLGRRVASPLTDTQAFAALIAKRQRPASSSSVALVPAGKTALQ